MNRLRIFFLLLCGLVATPIAAKHLWRFTTEARSTAHALSGEEVFILAPAKTFYEGGYFGLRCREGHTGTCYGGTQMLLDGLTLRALPSDWLKTGELLKATEISLPQLIYPRMLETLRWTRVAYALGLLLAFALLAYYFTRDLSLAGLVALLLASSPIFENAFQGAKNNHVSAVWQLLFLFCAHRALQLPGDRKKFHLAFAIGTLATFVRIVLLPMVLLFVPAYLLVAYLHGRKWNVLVADAVGAGAVFLSLYFLLNPFVFVSSAEASWIASMLHPGAASGDRSARIAEFFLALNALWIWIFVLAGIFFLPAPDRKKNLVWIAYLAGNALLFSYINLKPALLRPAYYLPLLTLGAFALLNFWPRENISARRVSTALATTLALTLFFQFGSPVKNWQHALAAEPFDRTPLDRLVNEGADSWALDLALRTPVLAEKKSAVEFFDSFAETPAEVAERLRALGKAAPTRLAFTCWGALDAPAQQAGLDSPAAHQWHKLFPELCAQQESIGLPAFAPYIYEYGTRAYAVVATQDFLRKSNQPAAPAFQGREISPRIFRSFWQGMDHFGMPLLLQKSAQLAADLRFPATIRRIEVALASDCKAPGNEVGLTVSTPHGQQSTKAQLDASPLLCRDYPRLCDFPWFRAWSKRRFPPESPLALELNIPAGQIVRIELRATLQGCGVALQNFRPHY